VWFVSAVSTVPDETGCWKKTAGPETRGQKMLGIDGEQDVSLGFASRC